MELLALVDLVRRFPLVEVEPFFATLSAREVATLEHAWEGFWARPDQRPPVGLWTYWFLCGGRGAGKTRSAAQWVIARARAGLGPIRLVAGTDDDVGATMVEDLSGILACSPPDFVPVWEASKLRLTWPNGVVARGYSAEAPKRLRGKQAQTDWYDDMTNWGPRAKETFDQAQWGLRIGDSRAVLTASPYDYDLLVELIENPLKGMVRTSSTADDNVTNLGSNFFENVLAKYVGTEQEEAERYGRLVKRSDKSPFRGIDFNSSTIRVAKVNRDDLCEAVIVVDPTDTAGKDADEAGLLAMGKDVVGHYYVLEDYSGVLESDQWGERAIEMAARWKADAFVAENNRGEASVRNVLNAAYLRERLKNGQTGIGALPPIVGVCARNGKTLRAGPVRTLYLSGTLHHLPGLHGLEAQMRSWDPTAPKRPRQDDRIDALVHGAVHLAQLDAPQKKPVPRGNFRMPGMG